MPHAVVTADVTTREGLEAAGPEGLDDVELLLVPHPGAPARPLHKGASGGELSRVMLAVEVVSPESEARDRHRHRKPQLYAHAGIPHFWLV